MAGRKPRLPTDSAYPSWIDRYPRLRRWVVGGGLAAFVVLIILMRFGQFGLRVVDGLFGLGIYE